jgi:hypothetical protein
MGGGRWGEETRFRGRGNYALHRNERANLHCWDRKGYDRVLVRAGSGVEEPRGGRGWQGVLGYGWVLIREYGEASGWMVGSTRSYTNQLVGWCC